MLKQRLITALVLAPLLIWIIKLPDPIYFQILLVIVGIIGATEWVKLAQFNQIRHYAFFVALWLFFIIFMTRSIFPIIVLSLTWWMFNLGFIFRYPKSQNFWYGNVYLRAINGVFLLAPSLLLLGLLQKYNANGLLFLLLIIWSADTGAYFVGKHFGKRLLAPKISPKKTVEGMLGGVFASMVLTAILSAWVYQQVELKHLILTALIALMSVVGDLYESLFKRAAKVKNSGAILPGHGGILDRIDSLTSAVVLFVLLVQIPQINPNLFLLPSTLF